MRIKLSANEHQDIIMKTLIAGLGNPILGDDGVGWKVAEEIRKQLQQGAAVDVICLSLGGMGLMEKLIGYQRAILVGAFALSENDQIGSILIMKLSDLPHYTGFHTSSIRDTPLQNALEVGRAMGAFVPEVVDIVGIATNPIQEFNTELSPPIAEAVPFAARIVLDLLKQSSAQHAGYEISTRDPQ